MSGAVVHTDHVSKWYGQVIGLNDVTLDVPPGITGLLGPNGAGKSTFMKLITGQLKPSKGSVSVLGESVWRNPGIYRRLGLCPEQDAFYEQMTGAAWVTALVGLNGAGEAEALPARERAGDACEDPLEDGLSLGWAHGVRENQKKNRLLNEANQAI